MRPLVAFLLLPLLAGCFTPDAGSADEPTTNESADDAPDAMPEDMPMGAATLAISLVERPGVGIPPTTMGLDPTRLEARAGERVVITVTNAGQAPHNLVIEGLGETDMLGPGESAELEVLPTEAGEFAMYCAVGGDGPTGHRGQGMEGVFAVA